VLLIQLLPQGRAHLTHTVGVYFNLSFVEAVFFHASHLQRSYLSILDICRGRIFNSPNWQKSYFQLSAFAEVIFFNSSFAEVVFSTLHFQRSYFLTLQIGRSRIFQLSAFTEVVFFNSPHLQRSYFSTLDIYRSRIFPLSTFEEVAFYGLKRLLKKLFQHCLVCQQRNELEFKIIYK
jgi:hypothetical protein